jgi:hypothetical protein
MTALASAENLQLPAYKNSTNTSQNVCDAVLTQNLSSILVNKNIATVGTSAVYVEACSAHIDQA